MYMAQGIDNWNTIIDDMRKNDEDTEVIDDELGLIRHMVLKSLAMHNRTHNAEYGGLVLCCDSKHSWRKDYFPFYKAVRHQKRNESAVDWNKIFHCLDTLKAEFREVLPYKIIEVDGAEADDIIGVLCFTAPFDDRKLIISADRDFLQLQRVANLKQYDPMRKHYVETDNWLKHLRTHIIKGDRGDGIPSILNPDNVFVEGKRQRPISAKKLETWLSGDHSDFDLDTHARYKRNKTLIDLAHVPAQIMKDIRQQYKTQETHGLDELSRYMISHKLRLLYNNIQDFGYDKNN
jgi:hypothetical protein